MGFSVGGLVGVAVGASVGFDVGMGVGLSVGYSSEVNVKSRAVRWGKLVDCKALRR